MDEDVVLRSEVFYLTLTQGTVDRVIRNILSKKRFGRFAVVDDYRDDGRLVLNLVDDEKEVFLAVVDYGYEQGEVEKEPVYPRLRVSLVAPARGYDGYKRKVVAIRGLQGVQ